MTVASNATFVINKAQHIMTARRRILCSAGIETRRLALVGRETQFISLRVGHGQTRIGRRFVTIRPAPIFDRLPARWNVDARVLDWLRIAQLLVLLRGIAPTEYTLVSGLEVWVALQGRLTPTSPLVVVRGIAIDSELSADELASCFLAASTATRLRASRSEIAATVQPHLARAMGQPGAVSLGRVATLLGVSRQAVSKSRLRPNERLSRRDRRPLRATEWP